MVIICIQCEAYHTHSRCGRGGTDGRQLAYPEHAHSSEAQAYVAAHACAAACRRSSTLLSYCCSPLPRVPRAQNSIRSLRETTPHSPSVPHTATAVWPPASNVYASRTEAVSAR